MAGKRSHCPYGFHTYFIHKPGNRQNMATNLIIIIISPDSSWRAAHAPTCQNMGNVLNESVATECAHASVYICNGTHVDTWTHTLPRTHSLTQLSPGAVKEAPPLGQVLADVLSVLALGWYFGFGGLCLKWLRYFRVWGNFQRLADRLLWEEHETAT